MGIRYNPETCQTLKQFNHAFPDSTPLSIHQPGFCNCKILPCPKLEYSNFRGFSRQGMYLMETKALGNNGCPE
jgi:hypothetical protein